MVTPRPAGDTLKADRAELERLAVVEARWRSIRQTTAQELTTLAPDAHEQSFRLYSELATVDRMLMRTQEAQRTLLRAILLGEANLLYHEASGLLQAAGRRESVAARRLRWEAAWCQIEAAARETWAADMADVEPGAGVDARPPAFAPPDAMSLPLADPTLLALDDSHA